MADDPAPPSTWAKPAVEVHMVAVDGQVNGMPEAVVTTDRILHELDGSSALQGQYRFGSIEVHRNGRSSRQDDVLHITKSHREPRRDWHRPAHTARSSASAEACE